MKNRSRTEKALLNTVCGFADEIVTLICGLILPRLILKAFGSTYNGITSSITQFISCISLMKAGIGGVTRVALYKPLAEKNYHDISAVVVQTERFMRRIALIFIAFVFIFAAVYPLWISDDFSWLFTASLVIIISFSTFAQYYFGLTYQMVLNADQRQSVTLLVNMAATIMNTVLSVVIIKLGAGIHAVKLGSAFVHVLGPVFLCVYTRHKYHIDKSVEVKTDLIKQRWDAVGHEAANFVNNNTDIIVLTMFTSLNTVSVYTVYHYVTVSIKKLVVNFITGFGAAFGNMYAKKEYELMRTNLGIYELIIFSLVSIVYPVVMVMITPFAMIYTSGVTDTNYYQPLFGIILALAGAFSSYRIPYETIVKAVGHYRQTRNGAIAEACINIVSSVILVIKFGLIGVAIGTLLAAIFRTFQYAIYLGKNVIERNILHFIKHLVISVTINFVVYLGSNLYMVAIDNVWTWIFMAVITILISTVITALTDVIFYLEDTKLLLKKLKGMFARKKGLRDGKI